MKQHQQSLKWIAAFFFGGTWAYSFSTRIGLLFIVPLWIKIVVLAGLGINFGLLTSYLIDRFLDWTGSNKAVKIIIPIFGILLTGVIFLVAPYRSVPFRTTHEMTITAVDSDVKLIAVYSPDDNIVPRGEFVLSEGVSNFDKSGFHLTPGSTLNYSRGQTGGLTLAFTQDSGPVEITWDGVEEFINPSVINQNSNLETINWQVKLQLETDRILISLPGYTWGDPDPFWAVLGALLPIADFISLSSLLVILFWVGFGMARNKTNSGINWKLVKVWLYSLIFIAFTMLLIEVGFPNFIPGWFLLFFIPAVAYLSVSQIIILSENGFLDFARNCKLPVTINRINTFLLRLNQNKWTFWVLITIVALVGASAQLSLTSGGMMVSGDSVHYMEGARNLAAGNGYVRHISEGDPVVTTGFPPVYSLILVPGIWLGIDVEIFARYLNTFLLVMTVMLAGWIIFITTKKALPAFWAMAFFITSLPILDIYTSFMTEPLYLVLTLVIILLWYNQIKKPAIWKAALIGVITGIMLNTRLAGIALVPVLVLLILIYQPQSFWKKIRDAAVLSLTALIQPAAFFLRNRALGESVSESRGFFFTSFNKAYWDIIGTEISTWFKWKTFFNSPIQRMNATLISLSLILILSIIWILFRKRLSDKHHTDPIIELLLMFIPVYISVIVLNTIIFTPVQTPYGLSRYMIPIFLILLIILGKILSTLWKQPLLIQKVIILFLVLVGISLYFEDAKYFVQNPPVLFRNYTDRKTECGEEVEEIVQENSDVSFYTNNCEYFYYLTGVRCRHLPLVEEAFKPGGEVYKAVEEGDFIAYSTSFGSSPSGINILLDNIEFMGSACYFEFYRQSNQSN